MTGIANEAEAQVGQFQVRSEDGTSIAVFVEGAGPPLVLVHGGFSDHRRFEPLAEHLRDSFTLYSMDRRGRGASGDADEYSIGREFADVAAVADTASARAGRNVAVFGHSYGANCAMGAAARTSTIERMVLYEPGLGFRYPAESLKEAQDALAASDIDRMIEALFLGAMGATQEEVDEMRRSPLWPMRLKTLPTLPRELEAEDAWVYRQGQFGAVGADTLLLAGSESPGAQADATAMAASALPNSQTRMLQGQGHFAIQTDPALVAAIIREYLA